MADFLKKEDGFYLLLVDGSSKILLVEQTDNLASTFPLLIAELLGGGAIEATFPKLLAVLLGQIETVGSITASFFKFTAAMTGNVVNPNVGSGIYKLVPSKTNDTYYSSLVPVTTTNVKIP